MRKERKEQKKNKRKTKQNKGHFLSPIPRSPSALEALALPSAGQTLIASLMFSEKVSNNRGEEKRKDDTQDERRKKKGRRPTKPIYLS